MENIYLWSMISGIAIPAISIVLGEFLGEIDFDFDFDFDFGFDFWAFLPLSPLKLSAFLLGFGGVGLMTMPYTSLHLAISIATGFAFNYILSKYVIQKLKEVDSQAITLESLVGSVGTVTITIQENELGMIMINAKTGSSTFLATSTTTIPQGSSVKVITAEKDRLVVEPVL